MSYTTVRVHASCTMPKGITAKSLAADVANYFIKYQDKLDDYAALDGLTPEEIAKNIENYLVVQDDKLHIDCDSEGQQAMGTDTELTHFLICYLCRFQASEVMEVTWITDDTRTGVQIDNYYYNSKGALVSMQPSKPDLIPQIAEIINRPSTGSPASYINKIAEIRGLILKHQPDLIQ